MTDAASTPIPRRQALRTLGATALGAAGALGGGAAGLLLPGRAAAQATPGWPAKPLRAVVAFPAGGLADVLMRVMQQPLGEALGQPLLIDNRGGAAGNIAAQEVLRNGGDGHTLLVTVTTMESVNPVMFPQLGYDPARDLQPLALLANTQLFLVTKPGLPVGTVAELVAHAKANPGRLSYGSPGAGTTPHLAAELFKRSAGFFATHIPYRGAAPVIQDVMAGQLDFAFVPGTVFPSVKAGKLKLLAVASRERTANYPTAPTFSELGVPQVWADTLFGVYAPAALPAPVAARFNREFNRVLQLPAVKARFSELGADVQALGVPEFKAVVAAETRLFTDIVRSRRITAE